MNHHDQNETNWRRSLRHRLDLFRIAVGKQWISIHSKANTIKDHLLKVWQGKTDSKGNKRIVKPHRVDGKSGDRLGETMPETDRKLKVQRIDNEAQKKKSVPHDHIDESPDRTFVIKHESDRPDLKHVTTGEPEIIDDTAIMPIIDDSQLTYLSQTVEPQPASQSVTEETVSVPLPMSSSFSGNRSSNAHKPAAVQNRIPVTDDLTKATPLDFASQKRVDESAPSFLIKWLPGIHQLIISYQKRRKIDRSIRRRSRERVYRLKGYTTVVKVNRKRQSENRQRFLRKILIAIISILMVVLLFQIYNPIKDMTEWYRVLGINSFKDLTAQSTTSTSSVQTVITVPTTAATQATTATIPQPTTTNKPTTTKKVTTTTTKKST